MVSPCPLRAAERLEVQFDDVVIPVAIKDLVAWGQADGVTTTELGIWLDLLEPASRQGVLELLRAPLITDRSMARQMLDSWAGRRLLDELADVVRVDDDTVGVTLLSTLERLLQQTPEVTSLDLLAALPAERVRLDLDALLQVATHWRQQLQRQQWLVRRLDRIPPQARTPAAKPQAVTHHRPLLQALPVPHRAKPLLLQLWQPQTLGRDRQGSDRPWIVLMPGLGGSPDHFRWLGRLLSTQGWPVVVLEHPGSDSEAVGAWLLGHRLPPGAEVLPDRLKDLDAVLKAQAAGTLPVRGEGVVLVGHSMGALTALLASGIRPQPGLERRCHQALDDLPLSNLSCLLQCQLSVVDLPPSTVNPKLVGIVGLNSFGSLLWPRHRPSPIPVPVLLTGGTLDLITPPLQEQLELLLATAPHPKSQVVLVEGASHFSPIRVEDQLRSSPNNDLFQLGEELVGAQPQQVQVLLGEEITGFLQRLMPGREGPTPQADHAFVHRQAGNLHLHRINAEGAKQLLDALQ
ncbi:MAG: alpha/beta hydrolase [Synechococcus sp.]